MIKSVITAAGKGTRLLPFTKELPKEMMPIFSRNIGKERMVTPLLQFIFEQLYFAKIKDFCFVVGREKRSIEDHFTPHHSYLKELKPYQRPSISNFYKKLEDSNLVWINQNQPLGFGDAIRRTERYVGNNNFIVHAGDVAILGKVKHPVMRLIELAKKDNSISAILLCKKVNDAKRYGVPKIQKISSSLFKVLEVEEKPDVPKSDFGILPIYYFKPIIFECLKKIKRGQGNEFQLTDAIQRLIQTGENVVAITIDKREFELDVGTVNSYKYSLDLSYKKA